jgi:GT2 family glycosyltransferase
MRTEATPPAAASAPVAVVIVSYNVRDLLRACLESLAVAAAALGQPCRVVVVDNASADGSAAMVAAEFPAVELIASPTNAGFAGGNNVALRHLGLEQPGAPWAVLLLNPDTVVAPDALALLVAYLEAHPDVAVVGPQLRYGDGALQSSRRRFPRVATLVWESTLLEQWWPRNPWARRYRLEDRPADVVQRVDWLVGAALLVRAAAIRAAGLLDEGFFMYSEELEWQARLGRYGAVVYLPAAGVTHYEGRSSEQNLARRHINFNRSRLRYARLRWGPAVAEPVRAFLLLCYLVQAGVEAAKWLVGHKRALRRQRLVQYGTILRSGL